MATTALRNVQQLQSEYWLHATRQSMISMCYWREVLWNLTWSLRALRPLARLHLKKLQSTLWGLCRGLFHLQFLGLSFCQEVRVKRKPCRTWMPSMPWILLNHRHCHSPSAVHCRQLFSRHDQERRRMWMLHKKLFMSEQRQTPRPLWGSIMALEIRKQLPPGRRVFMSKTTTIRV